MCFDNLRPIEQKPLRLPRYIPLIDHRYRRSQPLKWPIVAITTYKLFRLRNNKNEYRAIGETPQQIRQAFGLASDTQILLVGVANDPALEKYWACHQTDQAPSQIERLGVLGAIGPNFSHFLDVPRTDNLFNRKRQLLCLEELYNAGVCPIPHLSAAAPGDWHFWRTYLQENPSINTVAVEFQTGNKNWTEGKKVLEEIAYIQTQIGRPLHLLMVGGGQFITNAAESFEQLTLVDSFPFMKAMKRRSFVEGVTRRMWQESYSLERQPLDDLLYRNIDGYSSWAESAVCRVQLQHNWPRPR
ncbi:MAG: DUF4417 domain-containing protein [Thermoguttaceae bacterium]